MRGHVLSEVTPNSQCGNFQRHNSRHVAACGIHGNCLAMSLRFWHGPFSVQDQSAKAYKNMFAVTRPTLENGADPRLCYILKDMWRQTGTLASVANSGSLRTIVTPARRHYKLWTTQIKTQVHFFYRYLINHTDSNQVHIIYKSISSVCNKHI